MRKILSIIVTIILLCTFSSANASLPADTSPQNVDLVYDQSNQWYRESAHIWIGPNGDINSRVGLQGYPLTFNYMSTSSFMVDSLFLWGGVHSRQANNPWEDNVNMEFTFRTNDVSKAESLADVMYNVFQSQLNMEFKFSESWGEDWYDGQQWIMITHVQYNGHIDWINMQNIIDRSVPRTKGGLAETIDVYPSDFLSFWIWNRGDNTVDAEISVDYNTIAPTSLGGHSFSVIDLLHVTSIKNSPAATDKLEIGIELPIVTNPYLNPSNDTHSTIIWSYHPNIEENQNKQQGWSAYFRLYDSTIYTSMTLTFDYEFVQWNWVNRDRYNWRVDPRGFDEIGLEAWGKDRMKLTPDFGPQSGFTADLISFNLGFDNYSSEHNSFIDIAFKNHGDRTSQINEMMNLISSYFGIDYSGAYNETNQMATWWSDVNQETINASTFRLWKDMDGVNYENFVLSTYGYNRSAILSSSNLSNLRSFHYSLEEGRYGYAGRMSLYFSQIDHINVAGSSIIPGFDRVSTQYTFDLYNPHYLGWSSLPWNNYTEVLEMSVNGPYNGQWPTDLSFSESTNNGIGWSSGRGTWMDNSKLNYFDFWLNLYRVDPIRVDEQGNPLGTITGYSVTAQNQFKNWDFDYESPWVENLRWRDFAYPDTDFNDNTAWPNSLSQYDGILDVVTQVSDMGRGGNYYDGSNYVPKFPGSGVSAVNLTLFRKDAPVNHPRFTFNYPLHYNSSWPGNPSNEAWTGDIDTTLLPDGEWNVWSEARDFSNNYGRAGESTILLENYVGTPDASINASYMELGTTFSGIEVLNWQIFDDTENFVTVLWIGSAGYIVDPYQTIDNGDGTFTHLFSYNYDTLFTPENAIVSIFVETLDYNGNWIQSTTHIVTIDNTPVGLPPIITLKQYPLDNAEIDPSVNAKLYFQVDITDDVGIKSVDLKIGDKTFAMGLDTDNLYYEIELDLSTWMPGDYDWHIEVVDTDENTHTVSSEVYSLSIIGDGPLVDDKEDPAISVLSHSDDNEVSGLITLEVKATDDVGIQNVKVSLSDEENVMTANGGDTYSYELDTIEYIDGTYVLTFTATDTSGKTTKVDLSLKFVNGRTNDTPDLGIPGFELFIASIAVISIQVFRRKQFR